VSKASQHLITNINRTISFFIDNIFVQFGGRFFQQRIGIHKGTDRAPLLSDLFLHAYDAGFFQGHFKNKYKNRSKL
jgi:hypothetical protein